MGRSTLRSRLGRKPSPPDNDRNTGDAAPGDSAASVTEAREATPSHPVELPGRPGILRWVYLLRVGLAGGVFAAAALYWSVASPAQTLTATLVLVVTLLITPFSYWLTHVREREPDTSFIYSQAIYDVLLVTTVVHLTGGSQSVVPPMYILLISGYTLMLPLRGGFLVAGLSCMAYIADVVWGQGTEVDTVVALQLGIFVTVALVVGFSGTKLRQAGAELSSKEDELKQLRLDTRDILGNIPTAVLTIDERGDLAYANPAAVELLGFEPDRTTPTRFMSELERRYPELHRVIERAREHQIPVASAEIELFRDGKMIPVGVSTAVLERRDAQPSVTAIMRDISDRKQMEELGRRTERLEAVAELAASLAHEIKNPLASIRSSVEQLGLREQAADDDRILGRLILRESDRLSRLLSDFIDFARIRIVRSQPLDLRVVAENAVELVRRHPSCHEGVRLQTEFEDRPVLFEGDEDLVHRVITNLVFNAVQAVETNQPLEIRVEVRNGRSGRAVQGLDVLNPVLLRVTDDGPGIPTEDLGRIFDPFFSGRATGTGLGLAIVHRAVRAHHGTVFVESNAETGTRFTVYLPGKPPSSDETPREKEQ